MKPARIILLAVALICGGLAALLVMRGGGTPEVQTQTIVTEVTKQEAKVQILVAKSAIGVGERLTPDSVRWQDWPEGAVQPEYVSIATLPDAPEKLTGAVARFEIFPGEPIRQAKLVQGAQGYLSAVLDKGMRGVSVPVTPESGSGGFIVPNDHVDVLVSHANTAGGQTTETVLNNVRVLAIGKRLGELGATGGDAPETNPDGSPKPQTFDSDTIATLELDPGQAQTLVNAKATGTLSLSLLSITDFNDQVVAQANSNQSVRLIRYGHETSVMSNAAITGSNVAAPVPELSPALPIVTNPLPATPLPAPVAAPQ